MYKRQMQEVLNDANTEEFKNLKKESVDSPVQLETDDKVFYLDEARKASARLLSEKFQFSEDDHLEILKHLELISDKKSELTKGDFLDDFECELGDLASTRLEKQYLNLNLNNVRSLTQMDSINNTELDHDPACELNCFSYRWLVEVEQLHKEMKEFERNSETAIDVLESCKHGSMMLLNLINDLLDLAKHEKMTFHL